MNQPIIRADELREHLRTYNLTPFLDVLEDWLRHAPTGPAIDKLANTMPHLWAGSLIQLARMAGFTERREIHHTGQIDLRDVSDVELENLIRTKTAALQLDLNPHRNAEDAVVVPDQRSEGTQGTKG